MNSWKQEASREFNIDFDIESNIKHLNDMINGANSTVIGLMDDDRVIGYMGICIFENPVGKGIMASEHFWYVLPEHRGIGAIRLLEAGMDWARARGCTHFIGNASRLAGDLHGKVCKLYEKMGFTLFETSYICSL
ncbi:MAG: GNAT family N-acetyltransferase [Chloroflexi bacterium]|nr:GNAT family N-acetyltransferase [Chloroflexota bacterium]